MAPAVEASPPYNTAIVMVQELSDAQVEKAFGAIQVFSTLQVPPASDTSQPGPSGEGTLCGSASSNMDPGLTGKVYSLITNT